ncbi:hypothetical protein AVEN_67286-1 [Araneus ventricosus]|uniref:Uncharacterized protein n=1 Tax=Araneus ventricosus TaxID=182803 RepID=A0A4Y2I4X1_ARAVE|nr:hypothetical protein AVEN_67286-1 [Araneus ventricosus]
MNVRRSRADLIFWEAMSLQDFETVVFLCICREITSSKSVPLGGHDSFDVIHTLTTDREPFRLRVRLHAVVLVFVKRRSCEDSINRKKILSRKLQDFVHPAYLISISCGHSIYRNSLVTLDFIRQS